MLTLWKISSWWNVS